MSLKAGALLSSMCPLALQETLYRSWKKTGIHAEIASATFNWQSDSVQNWDFNKKMHIFSISTVVVLLLIALSRSWTRENRLEPFKVCPSCRDPLGLGRPPRDHNAAGSTSALAQGEPCGVYTLTCAKGLRCVPLTREHSPLQALLQGRGICNKHSRTNPTERPHPTGKSVFSYSMHIHAHTHRYLYEDCQQV